jgi:hypothetical protein
MKTKPALACAILPLICAMLSISCSPAGGAMNLRKAAKDKDLKLSLSGTQTINELTLSGKNSSKTEHKIKVPAGALLKSKDDSLEQVIVAESAELILGPNEEKSVSVPVLSVNFKKGIAGADDSYEMASYGATKDPGIKKILAYVGTDSGKKDYPASDRDKMNTVQQAVWLITDKLAYDDNIGYIIDSLIFSNIMQQNPMAVTIMLDDAASVTDEASMQAAVYKLAMDKPKLREKLKVIFDKEYDGTVAKIRANIDQEAGPKYRQGVNDFIAKAKLGLTY